MCKQNIEQFLQRNIGQWTGLEADCNKVDIMTWYSFNEGEGITYFGTQNAEYTFHSLQYPGFTEGIFFYFDHDKLCCIATEYWSFDKQECAKLLRETGKPMHRLDLYWRNDIIENGEWVHPDKGITLGVIPATKLIIRVIVYPKCTLNTYKSRYYNTRLAREFPRKP
jgi:hypothetical protein